MSVALNRLQDDGKVILLFRRQPQLLGRSFHLIPTMRRIRTAAFLKCLFFLLFTGCSRHPATEHIKVVMKKYQIQPELIRVKSGDNVELEVSTMDVQHGLDIPDLGIHAPVDPGKPTIITFKARGKGEYPVKCGIICGAHHDDMQAKLIVE